MTANGFSRAYTVTYNHNYSGSTNTSATATSTFNGWATSASGSKTYNNSQSVTNLSSTNGATVTLYANWTLGKVTLPTPSRPGYIFGGWYKEAACTTKVGEGGASYTPSAAITLYAKWTLNTYTITYNGNGNVVSSVPSNQTKTHGTALTLSSTKPTRTRYTFLGWATSASATSATYQPGASFTTNANTTLYAIWQLNDKTIWIYNTGKIDAVDFVTTSTVTQTFDTNGKMYGKQFVTHSESNVYIGTDGKVYAKEFIKY